MAKRTIRVGHPGSYREIEVEAPDSEPAPWDADSKLDVVGGKTLANRRVLIDAGPKGTPDGFRVDTDGNLWCGWGGGEGLDGVAVYNPDAKLIGRILLPERCANLCFGGPSRNRLFMCGSTSLYSLYVNTQGAPGG